MQTHLGSMEVALRVLTEINNHRTPCRSDIEALREWVTDIESADPDVLACEVIKRALEHRASERPAAEPNKRRLSGRRQK